MRILTWEGLAESTICKTFTEDDFRKLGLEFKSGKDMNGLIETVQIKGVKSPFNTEALIAQRETILKEFFEGNLR